MIGLLFFHFSLQEIAKGEVSQLSRQIDTTTQASLMLRLRDHSDATAWSEFMDVYSPLIYGFCRSRKLQSSDAADVAQEVLMRVARAIRVFEYDRRKGLFRDWLARIVLNEIRRHMTKRADKSLPSDEFDRDEGEFESEWNEQFQQHLFATALERCKPQFNQQTWAIFEMSWLHNLPNEQVAESLGVRVEAIYLARSRVLKRLRFEVSNLADEVC